MDYCKFHTNKVAHVRCKTCHIPLCDDCKVVTDLGVFCSEECFNKAKDFQKRAQTQSVPRTKKSNPLMTIIKIVVIIVLIVIIALGLDFLGIVTLPMVDTLKDLIGLG